MLQPDLTGLAVSTGAAERAAHSEARFLADLLTKAFDQPWDEAKVRQELLDDSSVSATFLIREAGVVVATASARQVPDFPDCGYVHWVASDPGLRGQGLGRRATLAVLQQVLADGLTQAVLETDDDRLPAIRLYLSLGFVPTYRDSSHQNRWSAVFAALHGRRSAEPAPTS